MKDKDKRPPAAFRQYDYFVKDKEGKSVGTYLPKPTAATWRVEVRGEYFCTVKTDRVDKNLALARAYKIAPALNRYSISEIVIKRERPMDWMFGNTNKDDDY